jgi:LysR family transcriptional regulator, cys regulon transcriptional activator
MFEFLQLLAPHLSKRLVERAANSATPSEIEALFSDVTLPVYK